MRRGAIVQLTLLALLIGGLTTAVARVPELAAADRVRAGRPDRLRLLVRDDRSASRSTRSSSRSLLYSAWKFRAAPDDDADGPPIHGHTGLEIAWTAIPFVLVTSMAIISAVVLARNDHTGSNPLRVDVTAQQFAWTFKYPQQKDLDDERPPAADRPARALHASGARRPPLVLGAGVRAEAGRRPRDRRRKVTVTPNKIGTYPIICTELCGLGHAVMRSTVVVM